jgi:hypothetical protein
MLILNNVRDSTTLEQSLNRYMIKYIVVFHDCGTACRSVRRVGGMVMLSNCLIDATDGSNTTKQTHSSTMEGEPRRYAKEVVKIHCPWS